MRNMSDFLLEQEIQHMMLVVASYQYPNSNDVAWLSMLICEQRRRGIFK